MTKGIDKSVGGTITDVVKIAYVEDDKTIVEEIRVSAHWYYMINNPDSYYTTIYLEIDGEWVRFNTDMVQDKRNKKILEDINAKVGIAVERSKESRNLTNSIEVVPAEAEEG